MRCATGLNIISGANGQGKTNFLEAVFFLAMGRSFRDARVDALARWGQAAVGVRGTVMSGGVRHEIAVEAGRGHRVRRLDGRAGDLGETLRFFSSLVFASQRLELFRGGPDERRRFLDRGIAAIHPEMVATYREQQRALRQKNELLRRVRETGGNAGLRDQVAAFNTRLAAAGSQIRQARRSYVQDLQEILAGSDGPGDLVPGGAPTLEYRASPKLGEDLEDGALEAALFRALEEQYEAECRRGHALAGPQRDNLLLRQGDADLSRYGSSGQQRASLIALKISKMLVQKRKRGEYPVLLVDDVDAELDADRTRRALALLDGPFQALVASSRAPEWLRERPAARHFRVRNGIIDRLE